MHVKQSVYIILTGPGNGITIVTMPYHASSLALASQGRERYGNVAE